MAHPYFRKEQAPQHQRGSSRDISDRLWAAVYSRGGKKCVWCDQPLTAADHSIDHFDGDRKNNRPDNLLPSHIGCNSKRGETWFSENPKDAQAAADSSFDEYLRAKGSSLRAAEKRAEKQLRTPIPHGTPRYSKLHGGAVVGAWAPNDPAIEEIIREFSPGKVSGVDRLTQRREAGKLRSARSRDKRAREQPRRGGPLPFADDVGDDDDTPF